MDPEQFLEQLKNNADPRRQRSLEIIHEICREQHERGSKDFSIATIGQLSEQRGGPKTQPIRNKAGEPFRALIAAWANHTGGHTKKQAKPSENPVYAVLEKIQDPAVRAVMGTVLAENRKLKGQLNLLKGQQEVLIDMRPTAPSAPSSTVEILPASSGLTESEIDALARAVSPELFAAEGWTPQANGRMLNHKGRTLYKPGYITAIRKILGKRAPPEPATDRQQSVKT